MEGTVPLRRADPQRHVGPLHENNSGLDHDRHHARRVERSPMSTKSSSRRSWTPSIEMSLPSRRSSLSIDAAETAGDVAVDHEHQPARCASRSRREPHDGAGKRGEPR